MSTSSSPEQRNRDTRRGLGLAASMPGDVIDDAALAVEKSGYHSFWLNNPPNAEALKALGAANRIATHVWLGVGVIPFSHHSPSEIARDVRDSNLPLDRLYLGVGSGGGPGGVQRVADGLRALRSEVSCALVVAALGPRMCRLAGEQADGVLFNWLTPDYARKSIAWVTEGAESAGRPVPRLMAYVRVALGDDATSRLREESAGYEAIPQYGAHFKRMGVPAMGTAITGQNSASIQQGLAAWDGIVDELVVRAIVAQESVEEVRALVDAARPSS
jgi:alkanesulfonate monooxygenase SsuD/methylene tetrahydromethanopterin reductase-like flavin-dependent oxidoreductase (luciferase family)